MSTFTLDIIVPSDEITFLEEELSFSTEIPKDLESELEEERKIIEQIQQQIQKIYPTQAMRDAAKRHPTLEEKAEADRRSVYVGQVDYSVKDAELLEHFKSCGDINRVSIQRDKFSGRPKGFAYIEFASKDAVELALSLNETLLKGRQIKVSAKRTNLPFHAMQNLPSQQGKLRPQSHRFTAGPYKSRNMSIDRRRPVPY